MYIKKLFFVILAALCLTACDTKHKEDSEQELPERLEIADEYKWDLSSMYASGEDWEADVKKFEESLGEIVAFKGKLDESGKNLLDAIETMSRVQSLLYDIYVFAGLSFFEDMRQSEKGDRFSRAQGLLAKYNETTAYFSPELLAIPVEELQRTIGDTPGLGMYEHYIDGVLRMRDHTLSEDEEKLLAAASDPLGRFNNVFSAFNNADIKFGEIVDEDGETIEMTKALYGAKMDSTDRRVREDAWRALFEEYEKMGNFLAANYEGHVKSRVFLAKVRGFDSALHSATYRNAIPTEVYTNLIEVTREHAHLLQRYMKVRQEALGYEVLEPWDRTAPITTDEVFEDIPWEEAKQIVGDAVSALGDDYLDVYWMGFDEGWADVYESKGKRGGAYSWGTYTSKPYFSMNYNGTFGSVSTLAHEYGHSVHTWLANNEQPYIYADYRTFIAEIASMTNESILYQKMLKEADNKQERIYLLNSWLDDFQGGFFRQVLFADFELRAHQAVEDGEALSKDTLNEIYRDTWETYYGDTVRMDPLMVSGWSRIPHFLRTDNFYVYQYSTSYVAAMALAKQILDEGQPARERFLTMLKSGSNDYPVALLQKTGIDMTGPQPIIDAMEVFSNLIDDLEAAL